MRNGRTGATILLAGWLLLGVKGLGGAQGPAVAAPEAPTSQEASVSVEKRGPATLVPDQALTYEIVVRNNGRGIVQHVRVEDQLPPGARLLGAATPPPEVQPSRLVWNLGNLGPGAQHLLRVQVLPAGPGEILTRAAATFTTTAALHTRITRTPLVLSVVGPERALVGETATFQIVLQNAGTEPLRGLLLRCHLASGLQHPGGRAIEADLGALGAGERKAIPLTARAAQTGAQANEVEVHTPAGLLAKASAVVRVSEAVSAAGPDASLKLATAEAAAPGGVAALRLQVRDLDDPIEVGAETSYEVRVTNQGTAEGTGVILRAEVPQGMELRGASGPTPHRVEGRQVRFEAVPRLEARGEAVFRIQARGRSPGNARLRVLLQADQLRTPVLQEENTRILSD